MIGEKNSAALENEKDMVISRQGSSLAWMMTRYRDAQSGADCSQVGSCFFPRSYVNLAENCLRPSKNTVACIFNGEGHASSEPSYPATSIRGF